MGLFENFRADVKRYLTPGMSLRDRVFEVALHQGLWATAVYRFGRWVYTKRPPLVGPALQVAYLAASKAMEITTGVYIYPGNDIGPGLYIGHPGGIHLNPDVKMGANCTLSQEVTLGTSAGGRSGAPLVGDNVYLGAGAKVIGEVKIGNGANVAANSLVVADVPEGATVMGVPGRVMFKPAAAAAPAPAATATATATANGTKAKSG